MNSREERVEVESVETDVTFGVDPARETHIAASVSVTLHDGNYLREEAWVEVMGVGKRGPPGPYEQYVDLKVGWETHHPRREGEDASVGERRMTKRVRVWVDREPRVPGEVGQGPRIEEVGDIEPGKLS